MRAEAIIVTKKTIVKQIRKWYRKDSHRFRWSLTKWDVLSVIEDGVDDLCTLLMDKRVTYRAYPENQIIKDIVSDFEGHPYKYWEEFCELIEEGF